MKTKIKQITLRNGHTKMGAELRRYSYYQDKKNKFIFSDYIHDMLKDCKVLNTYYYPNGDIVLKYKEMQL